MKGKYGNAGVRLTVTPDRLVGTAEEWRVQTEAIDRELERITETVCGTVDYWTGKGGDGYRSNMVFRMEETDAICMKISQKPQTLMHMAGIYERSELENREKAGSLAANILR